MFNPQIEIGMDTQQARVYSGYIREIHLVYDEFSIAEIDHFPTQALLYFEGKLVGQCPG
jgi:hypothetical protein